MNKTENYESLKTKIRKIATLAESGVGGEAENARSIMERICLEHGVSLDEVLAVEERERYRFEIGRNKIDLRIFTQCYARVTGEKYVVSSNEPHGDFRRNDRLSIRRAFRPI